MITTIRSFLYVLLVGSAALASAADSSQQRISERAVYQIPLVFDSEPGQVDSLAGTRQIDATEFSFVLTEEVLSKRVLGFTPELHGISQNTTVIVSVIDPEVHESWVPPEHVIKIWEDIWTMNGNMALACMASDKDQDTGLYVYYTSCNPDPDINTTFFLMDRMPDDSKPRPEDQGYIRGVCSNKMAYLRPEDGRYNSCLLRRETPWGDQYQFRLHSKNLRYLDEVEAYITSLLADWKN